MSVQVARLRKYGKKTHAASTLSRAFLDVSSPEKPEKPMRRNSKTTLQETSGNVRQFPATRHHKNSDFKVGAKSQGRDDDLHTTLPDRTAKNPVPNEDGKVDALAQDVAALDLTSHVSQSKGRPRKSPASSNVDIRPHPAALGEDIETYLEPLLECKNVGKTVESFQDWMNERERSLTLKKIGEGSFGEVYRAESEETVILKLMPLNAKKGKGSRSFTSITSARNEIRLLGRMSKVPGFVEFRGACILQGNLPTQLIKEWDTYLESGRTVESRNPHKKDSYPASQLWLLIEMSDAGQSLEPGRYAPPGYSSANARSQSAPYLPIRYTWDIFWQIVKALAKGEVFANYEHRDLHLGNICVKDLKPVVEVRSSSEENSGVFGINRAGVEVTLIDYSLSRASLGADEGFCHDFKNDKALLKGEGDLQYDMYRHMATLVGKRPSTTFVPETNILWLWYVVKKLLEATVAAAENPSKSSPEDANNEDLSELRRILEELQHSLDPENREKWPWNSAGHLLETGVERNWFLASDITDI